MTQEIGIGLMILAAGLYPGPIKRQYTFTSHKLTSSCRFVHLSDFHSGPPFHLASSIRKTAPDWILITGDWFDGRRPIDRALALIEQLRTIAPVCFVSGNHEYKNVQWSYEQLCSFLDSRGVTVLNNQTVEIEKGIVLTGIEDCACFPEGSEWKQEKQRIDTLVQSWDPKKFHLVMLHRPNHHTQFQGVPVDLMLSGHAHGGQVRIPGLINGVYAPQQGWFPRRAGGKYTLDSGVQIVSRGLSFYCWLPRFFNPLEWIVIDLKRA